MKLSKKRVELGEEAWAEYQRKRKINKAKAWKARNVRSVVEWRRRTKRKLIAYKGGKCEICGYCKDCPGAYDFHHRDPKEKEFAIAAKGRIRNFEATKKEVDKCQLVCKNCHAEIHDALNAIQRQETVEQHEKWLKEHYHNK